MRFLCLFLFLFLNVAHSIPPRFKTSNWYFEQVTADRVMLMCVNAEKTALLKVKKYMSEGWRVGISVQPFLAPETFEIQTTFNAIKPSTFWGKKHSTPLENSESDGFLGWGYTEDTVTWIMAKELIEVNFKAMGGKEISYTFDVSQLEGAMSDILRKQAAMK